MILSITIIPHAYVQIFRFIFKNQYLYSSISIVVCLKIHNSVDNKYVNICKCKHTMHVILTLTT